MLATGKLSQTFAPPGSGKSFLELDKALVVSQQYPVIYIAAEAVEDYLDRVAAWEQHYGQKAGEIYFWPEPVQLKDTESVDAFLAEIRPIGPMAIFVDPLACCMVGLEESGTGDMAIAVEALNRIRRETGAAVHVIHHTGWNDQHERGSSVLRAACRIVMKLSTDDTGLMTLTCEKSNAGKPFDARYFRLVASGQSAVPIPTSKLSGRDTTLSAKHIDVLEALDMAHFRSSASFTQILDHTGIQKSTLNRTIAKLVDLGFVTPDGTRNKMYHLSDRGHEELQRRLEETVMGRSSSACSGTAAEQAWNWLINSGVKTEQIDDACSAAIPDTDAVVPPCSGVVPQLFHDEVPSSVPSAPLRGRNKGTEEPEPVEQTDESDVQDRVIYLPADPVITATLGVDDMAVESRVVAMVDAGLWDKARDELGKLHDDTLHAKLASEIDKAEQQAANLKQPVSSEESKIRTCWMPRSLARGHHFGPAGNIDDVELAAAADDLNDN